MTFAQVNPDAQAASVNTTAPTSPPSTWGQVSGGPQAYAFPAILQLMDILMKLMNMFKEQANYQVATEVASAKAASAATKSAAQNQSYVTMCQAGASAASGFISLGAVGASTYLTATPRAQLKLLNTRSDGLNALDAPTAARLAGGPAVRQIGPNGTRTPEIETQIRELTNGQFKDASLADGSYKETIKYMNDTEVKAFSTHLAEAKTQVSKDIDATYNSKAQANRNVDIGKEIANATSNAVSSGVQASYQTEVGIKNGVASLADTNKSIAASMLSASQQALSKAYDEAMQALMTLQQLAASGRSPV